MTVKFHGVLGEPGLMPGQAEDVNALRDAVIDGQGVGAGRGYHAVGLALNLQNFRGSSGTPHPLNQPPAANASFTMSPNNPPAAGEPGWETFVARLTGARRADPQPGAELTGLAPSPLDAQTVTAVVEIEDDGETVFLPLWSGWADRPVRVRSIKNDSLSIHAREYLNWLNIAPLSAEFVQPNERQLPSQPVNARIRQVLLLAGYVQHSVAARYLPGAVIDSSNWDFFLPRRTQTGFDGTDSILCQADEIAANRSIRLQSYIHDLALIDGARIVMHHGIGSTVEGTGAPSRVNVPAEFGFPAANVQTDWGGSLAYLKRGIDDNGLYTTGSIPSGITLRPTTTTTANEASYQAVSVEPSVERTINMARWGRRATAGATVTRDVLAAGLTRDWARKHGIRAHERSGLMFLDDDTMLETAARLVTTYMAPLPEWTLTLVFPGRGGAPKQVRAAATLAVGHQFTLEHDGRTSSMVATMIADQLTPEAWIRKIHCVPETVTAESGFVLPRMPQPFTGDQPGPAPRRADIVDERVPAAGFRYGPRTLSPHFISNPVVFWTWPQSAGDLPILGWDAQYWAEGDTTPTVQEIASPWQCHAEMGSGVTWTSGGEAVVRAKTRRGSIEHWATPKQRLAVQDAEIPPLPPDRAVIYRQPGNLANVNVGYEMPQRVGTAWLIRVDARTRDIEATGGDRDRIVRIQPNNPIRGGRISRNPFVMTFFARGDNAAAAGQQIAVDAAAEPPDADTNVPGRPAEFAIFRTATGLSAIYGPIPAGTGGAITSAQIEVTDGTTSRHVTVSKQEYDAGLKTITAVSGDIRARIRGRNASGYGPWSPYDQLPAPRGPSQPKSITAFRTSAARKASDGYAVIWEDPADIGNIPVENRPQAAASTATKLDPAVGTTVYPRVRQNFQLFDTAQRSATSAVLSYQWPIAGVAADEVSSAPTTVEIPALPASSPPRALTAGYTINGQNEITWACHLPECSLAGQPYQYRARLSGGTWGAPFEIATAAASRPAIQTLTGDRTKSNTVQVQARVQGETWADSSTAEIIVPAQSALTVDTDLDRITGGPIRGRWMDLAVSDLPAARTGEVTPAVSNDNAYTLVLMFNPPTLSQSGQTWASSLIEVHVNDG